VVADTAVAAALAADTPVADSVAADMPVAAALAADTAADSVAADTLAAVATVVADTGKSYRLRVIQKPDCLGSRAFHLR